MLKDYKVANKAKTRDKLLVYSIVVVLVEKGVVLRVVVAKTATRLIKRPLRYI